MRRDHKSAECAIEDCENFRLSRMEILAALESFPVSLTLEDYPHEDPLAVHIELAKTNGDVFEVSVSRDELFEAFSHKQESAGFAFSVDGDKFFIDFRTACDVIRATVPTAHVMTFLNNTSLHDGAWRAKQSEVLINEALEQLLVG